MQMKWSGFTEIANLGLRYMNGIESRGSHMLGTTMFKIPEANFISEIPSKTEHNINIKKSRINL